MLRATLPSQKGGGGGGVYIEFRSNGGGGACTPGSSPAAHEVESLKRVWFALLYELPASSFCLAISQTNICHQVIDNIKP